MSKQKTFLVFGGTGQTGQHFVSHALAEGHRVRVLPRNPAKFAFTDPALDVRTGSITNLPNLEELVHRAAIGSNGPSKGTLQRSRSRVSIAPFIDCAIYNYRTLMDPSAIHTCDTSHYAKLSAASHRNSGAGG